MGKSLWRKESFLLTNELLPENSVLHQPCYSISPAYSLLKLHWFTYPLF